MKKPTLCMIFEAIGPFNAIGRVAMNGVRIALEAGYQVSVVTKVLDELLQSEVEWLKLYVPPRLFYVQWVTARHFMKQALGERSFDITYSHQPQVAAMSDVFHCHFLTRVAYERHCFEARQGVKPALMRMQEHGVLRAEDRCYRNWNDNTRMLFCSDLLSQEFARIYGAPKRFDVFYNSMSAVNFPTPEERKQARIALLGHDYEGPVLGYIGGVNERKGYRRLIEGLSGDNNVFLLMGGNGTAGYDVPALRGRFKSVGLVQDTQTFYRACDAFAVPSNFDPCPLVVFEAAAAGLPVIATEGVGNLHALTRYEAGLEWKTEVPLAPLVHEMVARRDQFQAGARRMAEAFSYARYQERLRQIYDEVLREKYDGARGPFTAPAN